MRPIRTRFAKSATARSPARLLIVAVLSLACVAAAPVPVPSVEAPLHLVLRERDWHRSIGAGGADQIGGISVGTGDIYEATATKQIGKIYLTFFNVEVDGGKVKTIFSSGIIRLAEGDLAVESVVSVADDEKRKAHVYTVTGGTGAYANLRGHGINRFATLPSVQEMWLTR